MTSPHFVYCAELIGVPAAKIGMSVDPIARVRQFRNQAPFDMRFRKVLSFADARLAGAAEGYALSMSNRYRERGEWVSVDERLDEVLSSIGGSDCTCDFSETFAEGRSIAKEPDEPLMRKRLFAATVGLDVAAQVRYDGEPETFDAGLVQARLVQGYGVEDIQVMDGIPADFSRRLISDWRVEGSLNRRLGVSGDHPSIFRPHSTAPAA